MLETHRRVSIEYKVAEKRKKHTSSGKTCNHMLALTIVLGELQDFISIGVELPKASKQLRFKGGSDAFEALMWKIVRFDLPRR